MPERRVCPKHGKPYPLREWRGKTVQDNCPDCAEEVISSIRKALGGTNVG